MFAEVAFDVQSAGGSCGEVGAGTVDAIDLLLEAGDVAGRRIVQIQVVDVFQGIEHVASIDDLTAPPMPIWRDPTNTNSTAAA